MTASRTGSVIASFPSGDGYDNVHHCNAAPRSGEGGTPLRRLPTALRFQEVRPMRAILAGLALLILPLATRADEAVELRWRFDKGQVHKYLLRHREVRTVAVADQKVATTTDAEDELQWTVKDVDDQGAATIEQKMTALRINSSGKDWDFAYDSSRGNEAAEEYKKKLIQFYDQLRYTTYRLKLKADGTVAEVQGFDKLLNEIG